MVCAARRLDRIEALAKEIDGRAVQCDVTKASDVAALAEAVGDRVDLLLNNAGGAFGFEPVEGPHVAQPAPRSARDRDMSSSTGECRTPSLHSNT